MTAKQKANRERFKAAIAEAKKIREKNPKLTQAEAVKKAWAIIYSKKNKISEMGKVAIKKAAKKSPAKKTAAKSTHKDTKSHNVNIRVMSGDLKNVMSVLEFYKKLKTEISQRENVIFDVQKRKKELVEKNGLRWYNNWIKHSKKIVTAQKKLLTQVKKQMQFVPMDSEKMIMLVQALISLGTIYGIIKTRVEIIEKRMRGFNDLSERVARMEEKINFIYQKLKLQ